MSRTKPGQPAPATLHEQAGKGLTAEPDSGILLGNRRQTLRLLHPTRIPIVKLKTYNLNEAVGISSQDPSEMAPEWFTDDQV